MGERSQLLSTGFELQTNNQDAANMYQEMAELLGITPRQVMDFAMTMMVYTQGMPALLANGWFTLMVGRASASHKAPVT